MPRRTSVWSLRLIAAAWWGGPPGPRWTPRSSSAGLRHLAASGSHTGRNACVAAALVALLGAGCSRRPQQPPLTRAAEYLWKQQSKDGGWPSHTYGLLRSGQALTPFVLDALLEIPNQPTDKIDRAIEFIRKNTSPDGALGMMDPTLPDYPNYATPLAVSSLSRARRPGWQQQMAPMVAYLRRMQFNESTGWKYRDAPYGAWGMGGIDHPPPNPGHVDLSMTRYVIEALRAAGVSPADPALQSARVFVERCQNYDPKHPDDADGGFFFSTTEVETNKAGQVGEHFRSYGTTTADGILALLATEPLLDDAKPPNPRIQAAKRWLVSHHKDMAVPGFIGDAYQRWPKGLAFYYAAASTQAFRALQVPVTPAVADALERSQRPDGSWSNPENLVKEDDPLIATAFAVRALANR
ncbi:MAG TPA: prenyltransferase/squalene oxidase repeat-containing protein [Bryobacteraceae bacterium]|nr:prenyltransferase/squalene oxidase repeat-containing protein [Bryobacteraceae bacterium]